MPDRQAQERLADWRAAGRAEGDTRAGSPEERRAKTATRRARWAFEDAALLAAGDHGIVEPADRSSRRTLDRLGEASRGAAALSRGSTRRSDAESSDQRDKRLADDAEIARELDE